MKRRNEVIDWKKYLRYEDGKLYWKARKGSDQGTKMFNTRYADTEAGYLNKNGYKRVGFGNSRYSYHRIIWELHNGTILEGMEIDHINFNPSDNRIENLQCITSGDNTRRSAYQQAKGYSVSKSCVTRPYVASRTHKLYGTPCGAYMSYATAFLQGESNGDSR